MHRTIEYSFFQYSSIPRGWIVSTTCRRFSHLLHMDRVTSRCTVAFAGWFFFRLAIMARREQGERDRSFLSLFFFSPSISTPVFRRISTMVAAIRWTPRFPGCRVDKGGRKRGKNREDGIFFPFPRKVVAPWRGMRARNHHEWCWARTGASGVALASPRLGPKRNHHHPRAPPRRVHHPDRPRGGNSGGARQCTTPRLLLPPLPF